MKRSLRNDLKTLSLLLVLLMIQACETTKTNINDRLDMIGGISYNYIKDDTLYVISNLHTNYDINITSETDTLKGQLNDEGLYLSYNDKPYEFISKDSSYYTFFLKDIYLLNLNSLRDQSYINTDLTYQIEELKILKGTEIQKDIIITFNENYFETITFNQEDESFTLNFNTYSTTTNLTLDKIPFELKSYEENKDIEGLPLISYAYFNELNGNTVNLFTDGINTYNFIEQNEFFMNVSFMDSITFYHKKTLTNNIFIPFEVNVVDAISYPIFDVTDIFNSELYIGSIINVKLTITEVNSNSLLIQKDLNTIEIIFDQSTLNLLSSFKPTDVVSFEGLQVNQDKHLIYNETSSFMIELSGIPTKITNLKTIKDISNENGITTGLPSTGSPKILVLPIAFTNYTAPFSMVSDLEKVLFGTKEETGYHSLKTYYETSSYQQLSIDGDVLQPYTAPNKSTYYENQYNNGNEYVDYDLLELALNYHNSTIDYSQYDSDDDGYIDAIMMVYTAPVSFNYGSDLWWAYTYQYESTPTKYFDGVQADYYVFMGYDFIDEVVNDNTYLELNALTFIHETGHLLGLDDYYDYDTAVGPAGGIGGSDMMDSTVGDHNPYSKLLLGWIDPYMTNKEDMNITLNPYTTSGDVLIIPKNPLTSPFGEYLIIDLFTPTGLYQLQSGYSGLFSIPGIRIYHVNSTANSSSNIYNMWSITKQNNTDTSVKLLKLIEADGKNDIESTFYSKYGEYSENSDLFQIGSYLENYQWSDGSSINLTLNITRISNTSADLFIDFN